MMQKHSVRRPGTTPGRLSGEDTSRHLPVWHTNNISTILFQIHALDTRTNLLCILPRLCPGFGSEALTTEGREGYFECLPRSLPPPFTAAPKAHASSFYLSLCRDYVCATVRSSAQRSYGRKTLACCPPPLTATPPPLPLLCSSLRRQPSVQVWDSPIKEVHHV